MRRGAIAMLVAAACNEPNAPPNLDTGGTSGAATTTGPTTTSASVDTTAGTTGEPLVVLDASLDLEALETVKIQIVQSGSELTATVTPSRGYGVAPDGEALVGAARVDAYPEAGATIYTARLAGPAVGEGPCGDDPISLALALHHDDDATFVAGALTAYCGEDVWYGVPPIEPLRISGHIDAR